MAFSDPINVGYAGANEFSLARIPSDGLNSVYKGVDLTDGEIQVTISHNPLTRKGREIHTAELRRTSITADPFRPTENRTTSSTVRIQVDTEPGDDADLNKLIRALVMETANMGVLSYGTNRNKFLNGES